VSNYDYPYNFIWLFTHTFHVCFEISSLLQSHIECYKIMKTYEPNILSSHSRNYFLSEKKMLDLSIIEWIIDRLWHIRCRDLLFPFRTLIESKFVTHVSLSSMDWSTLLKGELDAEKIIQDVKAFIPSCSAQQCSELYKLLPLASHMLEVRKCYSRKTYNVHSYYWYRRPQDHRMVLNPQRFKMIKHLKKKI
jgi:hypothetical protein